MNKIGVGNANLVLQGAQIANMLTNILCKFVLNTTYLHINQQQLTITTARERGRGRERERVRELEREKWKREWKGGFHTLENCLSGYAVINKYL